MKKLLLILSAAMLALSLPSCMIIDLGGEGDSVMISGTRASINSDGSCTITTKVSAENEDSLDVMLIYCLTSSLKGDELSDPIAWPTSKKNSVKMKQIGAGGYSADLSAAVMDKGEVSYYIEVNDSVIPTTSKIFTVKK